MAEEVAQIIMNDAEENEDNEGESSVTSDSFQSTSDDEFVAEEPSSESEVETKEDGDISSTSFISSRVSSNVFMSVGQSKRPRMTHWEHIGNRKYFDLFNGFCS